MAYEHSAMNTYNGTKPVLSNSTIPSNSTFVWDFWEINQYPIVGALIVFAIGAVIAIVVGAIYWYRKRKERLEAGQHVGDTDDMHRLEDE